MTGKPVAILTLCICVAVNSASQSISQETTNDAAIAYAALEAGDVITAFREFKALADAGDAPAQQVIATMYKRGDGVPQDFGLALKWYYEAAIQGQSVSQAALGAMFVDGKGVEKNLEAAYKWYYIAAKYEAPFSEDILRWIASSIAPDAVLDAKARAEFCLVSNFLDCPLLD